MGRAPFMIAPGGGGIEPPPVTDLALWFDASSYINPSSPPDGGDVEAWADLAGYAGISRATAAGRPTLQAGVQNGRSVVEFDGVDDYMDLTPWSTLPQPVTTFLVGKIGTTTAEQAFIDAQTSRQMLFSNVSGQWVMHAGASISGGTSDTNPHVLTAVYDGASSSLRVDGADVLSGDPGTNGLGVMRLGATNSPAGFLDGFVAEFLAYGRTLTTTERGDVESYLSTKWGL